MGQRPLAKFREKEQKEERSGFIIYLVFKTMKYHLNGGKMPPFFNIEDFVIRKDQRPEVLLSLFRILLETVILFLHTEIMV